MKLIDTFHYHLMKYKQFRHIFDDLNLILDSQVLTKLRTKKYAKYITKWEEDAIKNSPYELNYDEYKKVQRVVDRIKKDIQDNNTEIGKFVTSKIHLNAILWPTLKKNSIPSSLTQV